MSKRSSGDAGMGVLAGMTKQLKHSQDDHPIQPNQKRVPTNPYLSRPVNPEEALRIFLVTARNAARQNVPKGVDFPITKPFCEIEARLGILKSPFGHRGMRVFSSGPKRVNFRGKQLVANAFDCTPTHSGNACNFEGGITKTHFTNWTNAGLSESSSISAALGVRTNGASSSSSDASILRRDLVETEMVETVYGGYEMGNRICFQGDHDVKSLNQKCRGKMENKSKLATMDIGLPAAAYDLRIGLATERTLDGDVLEPPKGWSVRRLKRRRSYCRRDKSIAWQLDVTETISTNAAQGTSSIGYEIEMELDSSATLKLVNETDDDKVNHLCKSLAQQLWWMICQLNPISDVLDVEEFLQEHPNQKSVQLALAQCGAIKKFMDRGRGAAGGERKWESAIAPNGNSPSPSANLYNIKFPGCMPVNFSRHNIEEVQRSDDNHGYFLSEKTDGVRHFMVFTGDTVVLVDRAMKGKQPIPRVHDGTDPMESVIPLIKPGTVLDGEVVIHRKLRRPVFIVFDVLCLSASEPVLHLPFSQRLKHLKQASFRTPSANRDMFAESAVMNPSIPLPLVRKNFVHRIELDDLLSHVVEDKGTRIYKNGEVHNHLTDGIIFQPNLPYVCGTDTNLLKWKYLDTVTIDVQIMPSGYGHGQGNDSDDALFVAVTGEEGSMVDMTRFIHLPTSELRRLEADRAETGANIAEVGLEPSTGEWYYLTMRPDKIAPNHISTVLGTLLELAESLGTEELRYRMSLPSNMRDTYRKDIRKMQKQLLEHQRKVNKDYIKSKVNQF